MAEGDCGLSGGAGTEGGFLGLGGKTVSVAERATLDRLAAALA